MNDPISVLWLCGPPGVGKTSVGWEIYSDLARAGVAGAYVDIDQLGISYPEPPADPGRHRMKTLNLGAVVANFQAAGARCVVVSGVVDPDRGVHRELIPDVQLTVCRLRADREDLRARFLGRSARPNDIHAAVHDADRLDHSGIGDLCIDTTGRTVADVTQLVRAQVAGRFGPAKRPPSAASFGSEERTPADGPVLILCGVTGVGKSRVGWQVFESVRRAGYRAGFIDLDQLGFYWPPPDGVTGNHAVKARNLAATWQTYRANGAECLVELPPLLWSGGYLPPVGAGVRLSGSVWMCQAVSYSSGLR
jgi:adenylylsulfate kinase-like enzyme